jgi:hypothetical protein
LQRENFLFECFKKSLYKICFIFWLDN